MSPAVFVSGPSIKYPEQASKNHVEGTVILKCRLTVEGRVTCCSVVRTPHGMDPRTIIEALERRRYTPATLDGVPTEVDYYFRIPFSITD